MFYAWLHTSLFFHLEILWFYEEFLYALSTRDLVLPGLVGLLVLTLLGLSSNNFSKNVLGKHWHTMHKAVFLAIGMAVYHMYLDAKPTETHYINFSIALGFILTLRWKMNKRSKNDATNEIEGRFVRNKSRSVS